VSDGLTNIDYSEPEIVPTKDPMKNDALIRNAVMDRIQADGFQWAWIVDADDVDVAVVLCSCSEASGRPPCTPCTCS